MFGQNDNNVTSAPINGALSGPEDDANSQIPSAPVASEPVTSDSMGYASAPVVQPQPTTSVATSQPANTSDGGDEELLDIKQKALQHLTPLVKHLEQPPADKFKTTMMMIQASDDQSLIPEAYEAANAISDEKEKAQALLDIVNEINYFTQKS